MFQSMESAVGSNAGWDAAESGAWYALLQLGSGRRTTSNLHELSQNLRAFAL